ncbi:uncharacterized protein LOC62_06G008275 [Vanrija pseudolonga]|uniref:Uncharacterized protein n=1 Tax=Vanrija pseudolonga TaxID=143232 RepID=A0AAF1BTG8_9TREE|nr:hypothetical protein LOC62_06G008275 [Vanrija pseudolonga]
MATFLLSLYDAAEVAPPTLHCAFTAGGEAVPIARVAPLALAHYEQRDESLNAAVWSLFPVDAGVDELGELRDQAEAECARRWTRRPDGKYDRTSLILAAPHHERGRIAANLGTLRHAYGSLIAGGHYVPETLHDLKTAGMGLLAERKARGAAEAVGELVERLNTEMDEATNKHYAVGNWARALLAYCRTLYDLYPWTSTPLIFRAAEAFELGVAQLEGELWTNMAQTALQLGKVTRSARWYGVARDCATAVIQAMFTSAQLLSTAYLLSSDAIIGLAALERDADGANGANGASAVALDDLAMQQAAAASELIINGGGDTWAHGACYSSHGACGVPWRGARPAPRNLRAGAAGDGDKRIRWPQEAYG